VLVSVPEDVTVGNKVAVVAGWGLQGCFAVSTLGLQGCSAVSCGSRLGPAGLLRVSTLSGIGARLGCLWSVHCACPAQPGYVRLMSGSARGRVMAINSQNWKIQYRN